MPAPWFWPLVAVCFVLGVGSAAYLLKIGHSERRFHASTALDITYEGPGTDCLVEMETVRGLTITTYSAGTSGTPELITYPSPVGFTLARLRVQSVRDRPLDRVRVWLLEARYISDGKQAHPHPNRLRWMHDNGEAHYESLQGRRLTTTDIVYIDLAEKYHPVDTFLLQLADPLLMTFPVAARDIEVMVEAEGVDAATGLETPRCRVAFVVRVRDDGGLSVEPRALTEWDYPSSPTTSSTDQT